MIIEPPLEGQLDIFQTPAPSTKATKKPTPKPEPKKMRVSLTGDTNCLLTKLEAYRDQMKASGISSRMLHIWAVMQPTDVMTEVLETLQAYADEVTEKASKGNNGRFTRILNDELALRETGRSNERKQGS